MILINFKTYEKSTGARAVALAKIAEKAAKETGAEIAVAVDAASLHMVSGEVSIPVFAQHVDNAGFGANTGRVVAEVLREVGAAGAVINHSEDRMPAERIAGCIEKCRSAGLKSVVCVNTVGETDRILGMKPGYLSLEHPDLIGSGRSITALRPEDVRRFTSMVKAAGCSTLPLCGAGVANGNDVRAAIELGACGVLVASAIVNARDQEAVIREMAGAYCAKRL